MTLSRPVPTLALVLAATLAGCTAAPKTYPVSGEPCAPTDPVKDISTADCTVGS